MSSDVDEVRYSSVIQAMNDIIAENTGTLPAAFTYKSAEVQSRQEMALNMGVNVETLTTDVRAKLSLSTDSAYSSFLVELNQRYYTMSFDMPVSRKALFASGVEPADLARYVSHTNPATYISSVTYGRRFYLLIESTETASDMRASIQASYDAALAGGSGHLSGRDVSTLSNVNVKVFALGGNANLALAAFNGNVDAVADFLTQGGDIDTGVPLSYTVRNVKDNSLVNVKVATDFDVRNCVVQQIGTYAADFENGPEGWTGYADFATFETRHGGIDGDYMFISDRGQGQTVYFRAPLAYGGDWSHFYGGEISFYMWIGGPGDYGAVDDIVFYDGSGNRLAMRFSGSPQQQRILPASGGPGHDHGLEIQQRRSGHRGADPARVDRRRGPVHPRRVPQQCGRLGGHWTCSACSSRTDSPDRSGGPPDGGCRIKTLVICRHDTDTS